METRLLEWHPDSRSLVAQTTRGRYRIVYSHGYHCLRFEALGVDNFKWLGQFPTVAHAKSIAQEIEEQERRLKAWDRYMRQNDPPQDARWQIND